MKRYRDWPVFGLVLALCWAMLVGLTPGQAMAATTVTVPHSVLSGASGNTIQDFRLWGWMRGRPVTAAHIFATIDKGWSPLVEPGYITDHMEGLAKPPPGAAGYKGLLIVSVAPWPTNFTDPTGVHDRTSSQHLRACANGSYNYQWQRFGRWIASTGNTVVARIAWEANGDWYPWAAKYGLEDWKECFRQVDQRNG